MKATYMFLSFRNSDKNINQGVAIIKAKDLTEAIIKSHKKGINPGGEVLGSPMTTEMFKKEGLEENRLYGREELLELGYKFLTQQ
jgi:hypothetical protein